MNRTILDVPEADEATGSNDSPVIAKDQPSGTTDSAGGLSNDNLDMVRNILFGEQVRENKADLASLERFVKTSLNTLQEEMQQHVDTLHSRIQTQHEETKQRIDQETSDIKNTLKQQRSELLSEIRETREQLQDGKVDRQALSSLLGHVAKELADEAA